MINTSTGHEHDGTDSRGIGQLYIDEETVDTTERSSAATSYATMRTATFTPNSANDIILGIRLDTDLKNDTAGKTSSIRINVAINAKTIDGADSDATITSKPASETTQSYVAAYVQTWIGGFDAGTNNLVEGLMTGEASYTITTQYQTTSGGNVFTDNSKLTVFWLSRGIKTTTSGKFS